MGGTAYVTNTDDDTVSVIDVGRARNPVKVGDKPFNLALDATANRLYVVNVESDNVSVISTTTKKTVRSPLQVDPHPHAIAVSPVSHRLS